jgi:hypothetical protein
MSTASDGRDVAEEGKQAPPSPGTHIAAGWCAGVWRCSGWQVLVSAGHDHRLAGGVLAGEDEQGAEQDRGFGGAEAEAGEDAPVLKVAEAVLDAGAGQRKGPGFG